VSKNTALEDVNIAVQSPNLPKILIMEAMKWGGGVRRKQYLTIRKIAVDNPNLPIIIIGPMKHYKFGGGVGLVAGLAKTTGTSVLDTSVCQGTMVVPN